MVAIKVKWGSEVLQLDVDPAAGVEVFKAQLQSATMVPADRMKIMGVKGGQLRDDADLTQAGLTEGKTLLLIGSAEAIVSAPKERATFAEDAPDKPFDPRELMSNGLVNVGNTCYLASAIQLLRVVPQLRAVLPRAGHPVAAQLHRLYKELDTTRGPAVPLGVWTVFMSAFPSFAELDNGRPMQHDAQEALSALLQTIHDSGPQRNGAIPHPRLFGGVVEQQVYCVEEEGAAAEAQTERVPFTLLPCNIDGEVSTLEMGLERGMESTFQGQSAKLGREASFRRSGKLAELPEFLVVHLVRMTWRKDIKKKAKVLKPVSFPMVLDAYTMCTEALKRELDAPRATVMERRDAELERRRAAKRKSGGSDAPGEASAPTGGVPVDGPPPAAVEEAAAAVGSDSGFYELCAVVSHKGRDADGGHYVAWVKKGGGWLVFDDENVAPVAEVDIQRLRGVGEAHIAYLLLYRARDPETGLAPLPL